MTADKFEGRAPQSRGTSPDQAAQPRAPRVLLGKLGTARVAPLTPRKHRSQTQTAAEIV